MSNWHETPEAYVVGAIMLDHTVMDEIAGDITPGHFGHSALGRIYAEQVRLWEKGEKFTLADVLGSLSDEDQAVAEEVYSYQATSADAAHFSRQVRKEAERRELVRLAASLRGRALDRSVEPEEVAEEAAACLHNMFTANDTSYTPLGDGIETFFSDLQARCQAGGNVGISTPFAKLNDKIGGWEQELVYYIGARPSVGKSALAVQIGMRAAKEGARVLYMILETSREQWLRRVVSSCTGISTMDMKRGSIPDSKWPELAKWCSVLSKMGNSVMLGDVPQCTPAKLRADAMRHQRRGGLDMIIIDYVQLMKPGVRVNSRQEAMSHVSQELLSISKSLRVPVIALAQLRREVQGDDGKMRRPVMSDLKESGAFEQDAAAVLFLHRETLHDQDTELLIGKQRDGPLGIVNLRFDPQSVKFNEITKPGGFRNE